MVNAMFMVNRELRRVKDGRIQMFQTTSEPSSISRDYADTERGRKAMAKALAREQTIFGDRRGTPEEWLRIMDDSCPLLTLDGRLVTHEAR